MLLHVVKLTRTMSGTVNVKVICFMKNASAVRKCVSSQSGTSSVVPAEDTAARDANMDSTAGGHSRGRPAARLIICMKLRICGGGGVVKQCK